MSIRNIIVEQEEAGERIDIYLANKTGISRSQIQKIIEGGDVRVNDRSVNQNCRIKTNDIIVLNIVEKQDEGLIPENIPVDVLYKDESVVVVNKPAGMVVYPAAGPVRARS